jgi:hypothetical protein
MRISAKRLAQYQNFLGVQNLVVGGEELLDGVLSVAIFRVSVV